MQVSQCCIQIAVMHMDDNLIHKVKSKYYKIIDFPVIGKGLNPLCYSMSIKGASLLT